MCVYIFISIYIYVYNLYTHMYIIYIYISLFIYINIIIFIHMCVERGVVDVCVCTLYIYYVTSCYDNFVIVNKLRIKLNREN